MKCDIYQKYDQEFTHIADAIFIMAARKDKQSYKCPKMDISKELEPLKAEAWSYLGEELRNWIKSHDVSYDNYSRIFNIEDRQMKKKLYFFMKYFDK